jgi:hypothetical protein
MPTPAAAEADLSAALDAGGCFAADMRMEEWAVSIEFSFRTDVRNYT